MLFAAGGVLVPLLPRLGYLEVGETVAWDLDSIPVL